MNRGFNTTNEFHPEKMKIGYTYAAFAAIFVLLVLASGMEHGERCQTPDRTSGTCIRIGECPSLVESIKAKPIPQSTLDLLKRSQCGFQETDPLTCCPSNSPLVSPKTPQPIAATTNTEVTEDVSRHRNLGHLKPKICGPIFDPKVINGNKTKLNEMPWMALVAYTVDSGSPYRCGGSIINDRYILTAAHCVKFLPRGFRPISVRLGEHDLDSEIDCEDDPDGEEEEDKICAPAPQDFRIEEIVAHPNFKGRPNFHNDIALIRLSRPIDFSSDYIRPICLPIGLQEQTHELNSGKVTVAGWGITENGTTSPLLLKASMHAKKHDQCADAYRGTVAISAVSQLCAGGDKNGDSCKGDSGGPLTYFGEVQGSPRTIQHGVVSFGPMKCGTQGQPGVYARVGHFMNWILDNLKP